MNMLHCRVPAYLPSKAPLIPPAAFCVRSQPLLALTFIGYRST
jgi:hypothetical protein